jgi:hypothetical protein
MVSPLDLQCRASFGLFNGYFVPDAKQVLLRAFSQIYGSFPQPLFDPVAYLLLPIFAHDLELHWLQ